MPEVIFRPASLEDEAALLCMMRKLAEQDFTSAMEKALQLARSADAGYLPGWCGPVPED